MSCTVLALPYTIAWVVSSIAVTSYQIAQNYKEEHKNESYNEVNTTCEDVYVISEKHFVEKSFQTSFMDKNILLKTLEEHGVTNIHETEWGKIVGNNGSYELSFEKTGVNEPYSLVIRHLEEDSAEAKFNDISEEYAINVQEASYNSIIEKIKENNMEIENEEVYDDNTIVLTINLE